MDDKFRWEEPPTRYKEESPTSRWFIRFALAWFLVWFLFFLCLIAFIVWAVRSNWFRSIPPVVPSVSTAEKAGSQPSGSLLVEVVQELGRGELPPVEEDRTIGEGEDLKMQDWRVVIDHPPSQAYLEKIVALLQKQSSQARYVYPIRLRLHEDRSRPGPEVGALYHGMIYFGVSTILDAKDEAELAFILAHEIGHMVCRHGAQERLLFRNIARLHDQYTLTQDRPRLAALATAINLFSGWSHTQKKQYEADLQAQTIVTEVGYDFSSMANNLSTAVEEWERANLLKKRSEEYYKAHPHGRRFVLKSKKDFRAVQASLRIFLDNKYRKS